MSPVRAGRNAAAAAAAAAAAPAAMDEAGFVVFLEWFRQPDAPDALEQWVAVLDLDGDGALSDADLRGAARSNEALIAAAARAKGADAGPGPDVYMREIDERVARLHALVPTADPEPNPYPYPNPDPPPNPTPNPTPNLNLNPNPNPNPERCRAQSRGASRRTSCCTVRRSTSSSASSSRSARRSRSRSRRWSRSRGRGRGSRRRLASVRRRAATESGTACINNEQVVLEPV